VPDGFSLAGFILCWSIAGLLTLIIGTVSVYFYRQAVRKYMQGRVGATREGAVTCRGDFTPSETVMAPPRLEFLVQGTGHPDLAAPESSPTFRVGLLCPSAEKMRRSGSICREGLALLEET
jgi:hypothetical protein